MFLLEVITAVETPGTVKTMQKINYCFLYKLLNMQNIRHFIFGALSNYEFQSFTFFLKEL